MKIISLTLVLRQRFRDLALLEKLVTQLADVLGDLQAGRRVLLEVAGVILRVVLIVVTIGGLGGLQGRIIARQNTAVLDNNRELGAVALVGWRVLNLANCAMMRMRVEGT